MAGIKLLFTFITFIILAFCYWVLNEPTIWWRLPYLKRGVFELIMFLLCATFCGAFVVSLWLN
jgi:hypothetical protein